MPTDPTTPTTIDLPPTPRRVRRRRGHGSLIGCVHVFILPHTLIGIGALLLALQITLVNTIGTTVQGRVTDLSMGYSRKSGNRYYTVQYAYSAGASTYTASSTVPAADYFAYRIGSPVQVKLLPITPHFNQHLITSSQSYLREMGFVWIWALFWDSIVFSFWWGMLIRPLISRNVVATGKPCVGQVTDRKVTYGKTTTYTVYYRFEPEGPYGTRVEPIAASMSVHSADYDHIREGQPVTVLYDPRRPKWSVVYEFGDYEVA